MDEGFVVLAKTGNLIGLGTATQPGSGETAVLYNSMRDGKAKGYGARIKKLILNLRSSHDSASGGIVVSESDNGGTTWETVVARLYDESVDGRLKLVVNTLGAPEIKVEYINSASVLTTFKWSLLADMYEQTI